MFTPEKMSWVKPFILYLKALELLRPLKDQEPKLTYTKILLNIGAILETHYAYPQAIQYYDEGLDVAEKYKFIDLLLKISYNKSEVLRQIKAYDRALAAIRITFERALSEGDEDMILSSLTQEGLILKDMGRYEEARASYRQIVDFNFNEVAPAAYRGRAWHNIAVTYADEKRYDRAAEAYQKAIHEKESGSQHRIFITWMDLGETYSDGQI